MSVAMIGMSDEERERVERVEHIARSGAAGVPALLELLSEPSWVVRRAVVAALVRVGAPAVAGLRRIIEEQREDEGRLAAAVDALAATSVSVDDEMLDMTRSATPAVICDAIQVLGRRSSRHALPRLIELSSHPDDNVAVAAIEALGRIGGVEIVDSLIAAVEARHFFRTFPALDALGRTGDVRAVAPLASLLSDPLYVAEAARALGRTGQELAVAPLATLLTGPTDALVRTAVIALAELRERYEARFGDAPAIAHALTAACGPTAASARIVATLPRAGTTETVSIARVLAWLGDPLSIATLIELVTEPDPVGGAATGALRRLASEAVPHIVAAIVDGDSARRARLLAVIGGGAAGSIDALVLCLEDPDPDVKVRACEALARLGDTSAVPALFRSIGDRDAGVSQAAAAAIQSLGSLETRRLSLERARSTDPRTRRAALRIISYFGYPEGLDILVEAMADADEKIREAAIYGLPLIEDARALSALLRGARHPEARTRAAVARALGQTQSSAEVVDTLHADLEDEDAWVRYYATQSLGRLKVTAATPWLVERIADESGQVRVAAVESLAYLDDPSAEEALIEAARSSDHDMQRAALVGLGIKRGSAALPLLREGAGATDPATRLVAVGALAGLDAPEVVPALAHAATDPDDAVRGAAIGYLATRPTDDATLALLRLLPEPDTRERVLDALAVAADERVEAVLASIEAADPEHAALHVAALTRMRRPSSQAALASLLSSSSVYARRAAAEALASLATAEAREALLRASATDPDPDVRRICTTFAKAG